jgi:hypothetical protein
VGTGKAFGDIISKKLDEIPNLALLDGDLASSLGVTAVTQHSRFFQVRALRFRSWGVRSKWASFSHVQL